ncbi:unnamed protein product [Tetraodon nigroviridis]|uniref:Chromosome undetermined SCAF14504, whole genome shotgun sequence n=1 Tax=Tetraodon nigroviridis TaxID=99883 RepID=Q4SRQ4_TETNG|nr:unnamed protein product [Tetraodon nigroviridis]
MEADAARQQRRHRRVAALAAASAALAAASVAFCVLLSVSAAELRNRVLDLEQPGGSAEDLDVLVEQKVKELLAQVDTRTQRDTHTHTQTHTFRCLLSRFSARSRITSRSGPRDRRHLTAAAPQVS